MSLRVLLADESSSIKKAFELALQDYQVKVQTVHQGADVTELHESFQPDICFIDVMLPKVNGYDACKNLKSKATTPVVLMWSGFMELDAAKFQSSGAEDSIEKPFETKSLRALIQKLVPSLGQNEISKHLIFDDEPVDKESVETASPVEIPALTEGAMAGLPDLPSLPQEADTSFARGDLLAGEDDDELTDPGEFESESLPPLQAATGETQEETEHSPRELPEIDTSFLTELEPKLEAGELDTSHGEETWTDEPLAPEGLEDVDSFSLTSLDAADKELPFESIEGPEGLDLPPVPAPDFGLKETQNPSDNTEQVEALKSEDELVVSNNTQVPQLSKEELKRLILAQSKDIIESVVWDVVPELAKEMIQKEISRLTGEIQIESDLR